MKTILELRAGLLRAMREWFFAEGFMEVETPLAYPRAAMDLHIRSMRTSVHADGRTFPLFLQSSPEFCMKRLLAEGSGNIYQICKAFRDGEVTDVHNPEFTILEFYRVGVDYKVLMEDIERLIRHVIRETTGTTELCWMGRRIRVDVAWPRVTMRGLFLEHTGIDLFSGKVGDALRAFVRARDYPCSGRETFEDLFDHVFVQEIHPHLAACDVTFVTDYPTACASLARLSRAAPPVAERVELYIAGMELANGFSELTDAEEQEARFRVEQERRCAAGLPVHAIDERFLDALRSGLPECAGVAVGVDRLLMLIAGATRIEDVIFGTDVFEK